MDPSAASFIAVIRKHNKFRVIKAVNDVLDGIRNVASALNQILIKYNDCCIETFKEFYSYVWDEKAAERGEDKTLVYIVCNFAGLLSKVSADMLFGEEVRFAPPGEDNKKNQEAIQNIVNDNFLHTLNYEMSLSSSWRGETIYKIRYGKFADWAEKDYGIIEAVSPGIFWPILESDNIRGLKGGVFGWVKALPGTDKKYLRIERQLPGRIENELWQLDNKRIVSRVKLNTFEEYKELPEVQETRFPGLLFQFVPNWRLDDEGEE